MNRTKLLFILAGISLFVLTTGLSYFLFSTFHSRSRLISPVGSPSPTPKKSRIDPALPRTEACPLNGAMFTVQEKDIWSTRRPLAVMIENHLDSRPLSGIGSADIIYEAVAEGGITRLMGVFYCGAAADNITLAPVRSARIYFTKLVPEYDALYNHVGGAGNCDDPTVDERAKALCFIRRNKIKDLDQFGLDFKTCHRVTNRLDREVAYEHTMACYTDELYKVAAKRKWDGWNFKFVPWKFKEDAAQKGSISPIKFQFWSNKPDYDVAWDYDSSTNSYLRIDGGVKTIDLNISEPVAAKNVVIQFVKETGPVDEHLHMLYEVTGTGKMLLFQDGLVTSGTWTKATPATRTKFMDSKGKEIQFNRGPIWIELIPSGNTIDYPK
ncbi:MAG: hypothetical protein UX80_C0004G0020 [Candidatus Amesbacteria bacterium GW2011_GWA2_47_11b]|uniref:PT repeat-containing protein n=2 Tax=Candidatus Amesiibacteriota TaxID=1752730 RepID=A0A0G1RLR4_9BACT|nr:MAG: hypothetical protein UX42_C0012G0008 [Microgenomates group bacterium GW2011_GWC1_46_20]KKU58269.1 MAG: hypothetical protein UX80_C0004G0020 [Candidatus Amesbacteria bacterium GW2011_GWA2_47_11b]